MNRSNTKKSGYGLRLLTAAGLVLAVTGCENAGTTCGHQWEHGCAIKPTVAAPAQQQLFATPEQAVGALIAAVRDGDTATTLKILGPQAKKLVHSGDKVADSAGRAKFVAAYDKAHALVTEGEDRRTLVVGEEEWPMPIPLVHNPQGWWFDTAAGSEEIINRRIGRNELNVMEVCRAYVEAQRDYAEQNREDHHKKEYAQRLISSEGKHDGLYWPVADGEAESPLGPLIAAATSEGYAEKAGLPKHSPYHGYYYRILKAQGPHASSGARNYVVDGKMARGFALIAYPATYGNSGIMTFIVNQNGIVYQNNFGPQTKAVVGGIKAYDPGEGWTVAEEPDLP